MNQESEIIKNHRRLIKARALRWLGSAAAFGAGCLLCMSAAAADLPAEEAVNDSRPLAEKADAPRTDTPKAETAKGDAPKTDAPKTDAPKPDAPKPDAAAAVPAQSADPDAPFVREADAKSSKLALLMNKSIVLETRSP